MSFALTERQLLDGSKTVTRRLGWTWLADATQRGPVPLVAVRKAMGLGPGGKVVRLREISVTRAERVHLFDTTDQDAVDEGFPHLTGREFVDMFCEHMRVSSTTLVTRIEFTPGAILLPAVPLSLPGVT
jgi:hypothetical protein